MKHLQQFRLYYLGGLVILLSFLFSVWPPFRGEAQRITPAPGEVHPQEDTTRRKSATPGHSGETYGEVKDELNRTMQDLDREMKRLREVELPKVAEEMARAMKQVDVKHITQEALASVDMASIRREVERAVKELDAQKIHREAAASLRAIDLDNMERDLKHGQLADLEKEMAGIQESISHMKANLEAAMESAGREMEKAKGQLKLMQEGLSELEKDGLIRNSDPLHIKWEGDTLILNGQKQSKAVSDKYRKYFGEGKYPLQQPGRSRVI
jgi:hypothetical protein